MRHSKKQVSALIAILGAVSVLVFSTVAVAAGADHLLISELKASPSNEEFVEVYNPTDTAVNLDNYYLAHMVSNDEGKRYFDITDHSFSRDGSEFIAKFPDGSVIEPGDALVVAVYGTNFENAMGVEPDFELFPDTGNAIENMEDPGPGWISTEFNGQITDDYGAIVLFYWDGASDLVKDVDIVSYGAEGTAVFICKTGISKDGPDDGDETSAYLSDTSPSEQSYLAAPLVDELSWQRPDDDEGNEPATGGNGITGHDETGEDLSGIWRLDAEPTPGYVGVNFAPEVNIISPADGDTLPLGPLVFEGYANDPEDGELTGDALVWSSDDLGEIGTGKTLNLEDGILNPGPRIIVLTATDSRMESASDTVRIQYGYPPKVEILSPAQGERLTEFEVGDTLWCECSAMENDGTSIDPASISWNSHRDGDLNPPTGYDGLKFPYIPSDIGVNMLSISVTDEEGLVSADTALVVLGTKYASLKDLIADKNNNDGKAVTVLATLTMEKGTANEYNGYLQDDSGYGILAYGDLSLDRWELAEIDCIFSIYNDSPELKDFGSVKPVTGDLALQKESGIGGTPFEITTREANDDRWDATIVTVEGIIISDPVKAGPGWNIGIDDGSGPITIRLWESTGISSETFIKDSRMKVTGVGSLYMTSYQITPGYKEDIVYLGEAQPSESAVMSVPPHPFAPGLGESFPITINSPFSSHSVLTLFDLRGREVVTLFDGVLHGEETIPFDGRDRLKHLLAPGTYIAFLDVVEDGSGRRTTMSAPVVIGVKLK